MKNFLAGGLAPDATKQTARSYFANMGREELNDAALELFNDARRTANLTPGITALGGGLGLASGELVNWLLSLWGKSSLPLAGAITEHIAVLRAAPHAVLAGLLFIYGYNFENRAQAVAVFAGLGLSTASLIRFLDWWAANGDKDAAQEKAMAERIQFLENELATLKGGAPKA